MEVQTLSDNPNKRISVVPTPPAGFVPDHLRDDLVIIYDGFTPVEWPTKLKPWDESEDLSQDRIKIGTAAEPKFPAFTWEEGTLVIKSDGFVAQNWPSPNPPWHNGGGPDLSQPRIKKLEGTEQQFGQPMKTDGCSSNSPPPFNPDPPWSHFEQPEPDGPDEPDEPDEDLELRSAAGQQVAPMGERSDTHRPPRTTRPRHRRKSR